MRALRKPSFCQLAGQSLVCVLLAIGTITLATQAKVGEFHLKSDAPASSVMKMKLATAGKQSLAMFEDRLVEIPFLIPSVAGPVTPPRTHCVRCRPADFVPYSELRFPPRLWQRPPPSV